VTVRLDDLRAASPFESCPRPAIYLRAMGRSMSDSADAPTRRELAVTVAVMVGVLAAVQILLVTL
jgi:hypothetical protein